MQLGDALKKTAKKSKKVKAVRTKPTVAQKDRPYQSAPSDAARKARQRPSAIVGDLVVSLAQQLYGAAKMRLTETYETKVKSRADQVKGLVKKFAKA